MRLRNTTADCCRSPSALQSYTDHPPYAPPANGMMVTGRRCYPGRGRVRARVLSAAIPVVPADEDFPRTKGEE